MIKWNRLAALTVLSIFVNNVALAGTVDLGGPATGFLSVSSFKGSTTQNAIEGLDVSGNPTSPHNGLPDYPNFLLPGVTPDYYSAIIASPQSATNDYSVLSDAFHAGAPITVNNQTVTQADASTMSAGHINYDSALLSGTGSENISIAQLAFDFDTYNWDGVTTGDGGPYTTNKAPGYISPFSPVHTEYNDAGGAGNAQLFYNLSISNVSGTGLDFQDGELVNMDIQGDLSVFAAAASYPAIGGVFSGTFSTSGLQYEFDVNDTQGFLVFSGVNMFMNRTGTASVVPEPTTGVLITLSSLFVGGLARRRTV